MKKLSSKPSGKKVWQNLLLIKLYYLHSTQKYTTRGNRYLSVVSFVQIEGESWEHFVTQFVHNKLYNLKKNTKQKIFT